MIIMFNLSQMSKTCWKMTASVTKHWCPGYKLINKWFMTPWVIWKSSSKYFIYLFIIIAQFSNKCDMKKYDMMKHWYLIWHFSIGNLSNSWLIRSRLVIENAKRKKVPDWHHQWIWALWQPLIIRRCVLTSGYGNSIPPISGLDLVSFESFSLFLVQWEARYYLLIFP